VIAGRPFAVLLLALTVPVSPASAQGLGDAAASARAKRQKQAAGGTGKSFSNEDLERGKPAAAKKTKASSAAPSESAPSTTSETESAPEPEAPPQSEPPPEPPAEPVAEPPTIPELEARVKLLQDKLNPMSGTYIFGPFGSGDPTEEPRTRNELQQLEADLAKAREAAERALAAPQEESEPVF
jgi:hypothetical protein